MINISDKHNCCGCSACSSICPKHCITMQADNEGFLYPKVNETDCIDCGLCEKVCHELHPFDEKMPLKAYAVMNRDERIRMKSSSGGVFYQLAKKTIDNGGVVFGARFDEKWQVVIDYAEEMKGVEDFMGSKYVQARMGSAYTDAKRFLTEGRLVLFTGTPCQIAGLHHFLRKDYENLVTVDFICHGTPSPKVWERYLEETVQAGKRLSCVEFRNKQKGWKQFSFHLVYNQAHDSVSLIAPFSENVYMQGFLSDLILRPSCYACKAKAGRSHSDMTIADFWGIDQVNSSMDDDKGTSLVLLNSPKGADFMDLEQMNCAETSYYDAVAHNTSHRVSVAPHAKRAKFFRLLDKRPSVSALITDTLKYSLYRRIRIKLGWLKQIIFRMLLNRRAGGYLEDKNHPSEQYLTIPNQAQMVAISFRNKQKGWKDYEIEIELK